MPCWLIGYDIADPARLQRVHRTMLRHGFPLEYSIFLLTGTVHDHDRCMREVIGLIDEAEDDLRAYPLPDGGYRERIGVAALPEGIHWTGLPPSLT